MFRQISEQEYIIEGSMNLDDINDRLETDLVSEDYDSLGGFIIEHLDRSLKSEMKYVPITEFALSWRRLIKTGRICSYVSSRKT